VTDQLARLDAIVRGHVQGVGFRYFVRRRANQIGVTGWVANEPDGSVRCVAEGPTAALDHLLALLHTGPPGSHVSDVQVVRGEATGRFDSFGVRATGHRGD
jgi:acylphosphatase